MLLISTCFINIRINIRFSLTLHALGGLRVVTPFDISNSYYKTSVFLYSVLLSPVLFHSHSFIAYMISFSVFRLCDLSGDCKHCLRSIVGGSVVLLFSRRADLIWSLPHWSLQLRIPVKVADAIVYSTALNDDEIGFLLLCVVVVIFTTWHDELQPVNRDLISEMELMSTAIEVNIFCTLLMTVWDVCR